MANMANVAALVWQLVPELNWAGFYRMVAGDRGGELVLGPFCGKPACIRIPLGRGVCGTAARDRPEPARRRRPCVPRAYRLRRGEPLRAGRAGRDATARSIAVIDLDSPLPARFDADDQAGFEALAALLARRI